MEVSDDTKLRAVFQLVNVADSADRLAGILVQDDVGVARNVHESGRKGIHLRSVCVFAVGLFKERGGLGGRRTWKSSALASGSRPGDVAANSVEVIHSIL